MVGDIVVEVTRKQVRRLRLCVAPPLGLARIAAPLFISDNVIRAFALSKIAWIKKHQLKFAGMAVESPKQYTSQETHSYLGKTYTLLVEEQAGRQGARCEDNKIIIRARPQAGMNARKEILYSWYRDNLKKLYPAIVDRYERLMKVSVNEVGIKKMKTRWGTCNRVSARIWLNLELARQPLENIEYIIVHEMVHLLERGHNKRFYSLMDEYLPGWRQCKHSLHTTRL